MATEQLRNRWGIAVAAVVMQICLGTVYGWSVFKKPLMPTEHWTETSVQLTFTLAILFVGFGTMPSFTADYLGAYPDGQGRSSRWTHFQLDKSAFF